MSKELEDILTDIVFAIRSLALANGATAIVNAMDKTNSKIAVLEMETASSAVGENEEK